MCLFQQLRNLGAHSERDNSPGSRSSARPASCVGVGRLDTLARFLPRGWRWPRDEELRGHRYLVYRKEIPAMGGSQPPSRLVPDTEALLFKRLDHVSLYHKWRIMAPHHSHTFLNGFRRCLHLWLRGKNISWVWACVS